jgi:hypothetical protein
MSACVVHPGTSECGYPEITIKGFYRICRYTRICWNYNKKFYNVSRYKIFFESTIKMFYKISRYKIFVEITINTLIGYLDIKYLFKLQ